VPNFLCTHCGFARGPAHRCQVVSRKAAIRRAPVVARPVSAAPVPRLKAAVKRTWQDYLFGSDDDEDDSRKLICIDSDKDDAPLPPKKKAKVEGRPAVVPGQEHVWLS
jgi:hypothetical protein